MEIIERSVEFQDKDPKIKVALHEDPLVTAEYIKDIVSKAVTMDDYSKVSVVLAP